jgi:hypothetical protein
VSPAPAHAQRGFPSRPVITSTLMVHMPLFRSDKNLTVEIR